MSKFISNKPRAGRLTLTPDQAIRFVEVYCKSKSYKEVGEILGREIDDIMYCAQIMRSQGVNLPYLKICSEINQKVVNSLPPKGFNQ